MGWIVFISMLGAMWGLKAISIVKQHDDIIAADVSMSWTPLAERETTRCTGICTVRQVGARLEQERV